MDQAILQRLLALVAQGERVIIAPEASGEPVVLLPLAEYEVLKGQGAPTHRLPSEFASPRTLPLTKGEMEGVSLPPTTADDDAELWDADVIFASIQKERQAETVIPESHKKPIPERKIDKKDTESAFYFNS